MSQIRRPAVSWGDLLLFQALPGAAQEMIEAARLLGLPQVELTARSAPEPKEAEKKKRRKPPLKPAVTRHRLPLRCLQGFSVDVDRSASTETTTPIPLSDWGPQEAAAVERMLEPNGQAPTSETLLDLARLQAYWRSMLQQRRPGPLDLECMVRSLARTQWPVPLPRRPRAHRIHDLHLCIDIHPHRLFLWDDYLACIQRLIVDRAGARLFEHSIDGPWRWPSVLDAARPGQAVLFIAEPKLMPWSEQRIWREMASRLLARGATVLWSLEWRPEAWSGAAIEVPQTSQPPQRVTDGGSRPRDIAEADLARLLACLAPALTVEPVLVRTMIQALRLPGGLALEQAVWCHPDLDGALPFRQWHETPRREHLRQLRQQPAEVIDTCWRVLAAIHAHRYQVQRDEELLSWADAAGKDGVARRSLASEFDGAKSRYARVVRHLRQLREQQDATGQAPSSRGAIRAAAMQRLRSLPDCLDADRSALESLLLQTAQPFDVAISADGRHAEDASAPLSAVLVQQGQRLLLMAEDFEGPGARMASLKIAAGPLMVECDDVPHYIWRPRQALSQGGIVLAEWKTVPPKRLRMRGGPDKLRIDAIERPHWAAAFSQQRAWADYWISDRSNGLGMDGLIHWPDGNPVVLDLSMGESEIQAARKGWVFKMDRYGPRLSTMFAKQGMTVLPLTYFRYLPPGTFLQGSPEGIGHYDERPQHPVTLTRGLWLAETPCTQALWQAVMGNNPSRFKQGEDAPMRPVENVSWDDVIAFLSKLQRFLPPGCEAVLPTESEWEYACRAGTQTEFWWGDAPDDAYANWNEQQGGTTPVDRYLPNPWGLYDMHGNVWEWCRDDMRSYPAEPARDPEGPAKGEHRVVRGGSWYARPVRARSAFRGRGLRGSADQYRGFRFALRSPSGPEARPGGPSARLDGAAGGRTDGADAPAAEPPRRDADDARSPE